jgi:hypothetical protein
MVVTYNMLDTCLVCHPLLIILSAYEWAMSGHAQCGESVTDVTTKM